MKCIANKVILVVTALLAVSGCLGRTNDTQDGNEPTAMPSLIGVRTNQLRYDDRVGEIKLSVRNATSRDIMIPAPRDAEVGERTFRFYKKTTMGWKRLFPIPGYLAEPIAPDPGLLVQAGHQAEIVISPIMRSYMEYRQESPWLTGEFIAQIRYDPKPPVSDEFVQYSNEFFINATEPVIQTEVKVHLAQPQPLAFVLQNNSNVPLWFPGICSTELSSGAGSAFDDDGTLSLQRLTDERTWQIIRFAKTDCKEKTAPIRADPGQKATIDAGPWFQRKLLDLATGTYRWDVVFYLEENDAGAGTRRLRDARHVFSDIFRLDQ